MRYLPVLILVVAIAAISFTAALIVGHVANEAMVRMDTVIGGPQ